MFRSKDDDDDDDTFSRPTKPIYKPAESVRSGYLGKKGKRFGAYSPRFFVLTNTRLLYFKSQTANVALSEIPLNDAIVSALNRKTSAFQLEDNIFSLPLAAAAKKPLAKERTDLIFQIETPHRTFTLQAPTYTEYIGWIHDLQPRCIGEADENGTLDWLQMEAGNRESASWAVEQVRIDRLLDVHTLLLDSWGFDWFLQHEVACSREEYVLCWIDCDELTRSTDATERLEKIKAIFALYLDDNAKMHITSERTYCQ